MGELLYHDSSDNIISVDCLALVNCCVVVCFETHIELSVQQSVVFVFFTNTYKGQLYKAQEKKLGSQIQSV